MEGPLRSCVERAFLYRTTECALGEAKRKARLRIARQGLSKPLSPARFDIYAMGARMSPSRLISEELTYWSDANEKVLGMVFRDLVDNDFGWIYSLAIAQEDFGVLMLIQA
jgi:hypothetical protein